jgi:hypothetical protein
MQSVYLTFGDFYSNENFIINDILHKICDLVGKVLFKSNGEAKYLYIMQTINIYKYLHISLLSECMTLFKMFFFFNFTIKLS